MKPVRGRLAASQPQIARAVSATSRSLRTAQPDKERSPGTAAAGGDRGEIAPLEPDTTCVTAGIVHAFRNTGEVPMKILWCTAPTDD